MNIGKMVKIGGILSNYEIRGPDAKKLIYERCKYILMKPKKAKARKDFGHFILSLPDHPITPDDFQKELKKQKIKKLDSDLIQAVMNLFMKKNQIDCHELIENYMKYYPDTQLPPPKPKKQKKGKKSGKKGKNKAKQDEQEKPVETQQIDENIINVESPAAEEIKTSNVELQQDQQIITGEAEVQVEAEANTEKVEAEAHTENNKIEEQPRDEEALVMENIDTETDNQPENNEINVDDKPAEVTDETLENPANAPVETIDETVELIS